MKRRAALGALAAVVLAPAARGAGPVKTVGYLSGGGRVPGDLDVRLAELGWAEGKNLRFETIIAPRDAPMADVVKAAAELVRANVDVLVGWTDRPDAFAAVTKTIPIVAVSNPDPVGLGLADSLRRPGRNVTGLSAGSHEYASAWLGVLKTLRPKLSRIGIVCGKHGEERMRAVTTTEREVAGSMGMSLSYAPCATLDDVSRAFDGLGDPMSAAAFTVFGGMSTVALPGSMMKDVYAIATKRRIATRGHAGEGALITYHAEHSDETRRVAAIIDKIFRGQKAGEIPFELPDRFRFTLNRTTAKAIGANVTPELLLRATEVIG